MKSEEKGLIKYSVTIGIIVFVVLCVTHNLNIRLNTLKSITDYAGDSISISVTFAFFYEKYIWRWNPFEKHPRLAKKYSGYLISTFDDKKRTLELDLKQTLMTCKVHQKTEESDSDAINTNIIDINGRSALVYTYLNVPRLNVRERSPIHYGSAILFINSQEKLNGGYFTDRKTTGQITAEKKIKPI